MSLTKVTYSMILGAPVNILDYGADPTGVADSTAAFQAAINAGSVVVPPGTYTMSWASISADISIPANRKIEIQKGATVTMTGGRFTAENVTNVEWQIDGWLKSVAMRTAASKPLWTASVGERGFIEFAQNYVAGSAASGFTVWGSGRVSGDWTGTPNVSDPTTQVNRKGIACWNSKNVLVEGLEVFGFDGEAVYASFFDAASLNIVFQNNIVRDTRFNALNFNAGANGGGCFIRNNLAKNAYAIECSVGTVSGNYVDDMVYCGVWTGAGTGFGPIEISDNIITNTAQLHGIAAVFASATPVADITIKNNVIQNSGQYSIYTDYAQTLTIQGNKSIGAGTAAGAYDIGVFHGLKAKVSENTFMLPGGFNNGSIGLDGTSGNDLSIDPNSNVFIPATGTSTVFSGNGIVAIGNSNTTLTLPVLGENFLVSSVNITSIDATRNAGRKITIIMQSGFTLTDGSNLKLAGNFVGTADDTITLLCDGTNWFEVCRSVN